ncbi:MAG: glycosyltransferase family 39 protein [Anaerolineales bacterium]
MTVNSNGSRALSSAFVEDVRDFRERSIKQGLTFEGLTVEGALYGIITFAALVVRLASLGRWPLVEEEAHTALAAWRALQGARPVHSFEYIPLLYDANLVFFALTRASDVAVRLLPAFMGTALVLLPYSCRDVLGRQGSLMASLLLAFAPTWVFFSRTSEGTIPTVTLSAVILVSILRYLRTGDGTRLRWGFAALGLGLTAGPGIYTFLVYALLYGGIWWLIRHDDAFRERGGTLFQGAFTRWNVSMLVGTFLLFGSAFLSNPGGIGVSINLAGRWVRALSPVGDLSSLALVKTLLMYEFLTVVLGVVGIVWGLSGRDRLTSFLALWVAWGLLLSVPLGHREPQWLPHLLLPLVILAVRGFQYLWDHLIRGVGRDEGIVFWAAVVLMALAFLELCAYIHTAQVRYLLYAAGGGGVVLAMWGASWFWLGRRGALAVGVGILLLCMAVVTVRGSTALAYQTGRDAREGMVHRPASTQLHALERFLQEFSSRRAEGRRAMEVDYEESLDPWMGWYLRDYPHARSVPFGDARAGTVVLITEERLEEEQPAGYGGQGFHLRERRPAQTLSLREFLRWLVYRDAVGIVEAERIHVWVRLETEDQTIR